jgi:hypothetical protein
MKVPARFDVKPIIQPESVIIFSQAKRSTPESNVVAVMADKFATVMTPLCPLKVCLVDDTTTCLMAFIKSWDVMTPGCRSIAVDVEADTLNHSTKGRINQLLI